MKKIVLALDVNRQKAKTLIDKLSDRIDIFKIGHKLFVQYPEIINYINKKNKKVIIDLKYHDIPSVVSLAIEEIINRYNPFGITIHISGGKNMLISAVQTKNTLKYKPLLFGVTILTSLTLDDLNDVFGYFKNNNMESIIINMAKLAKQCGLDGVVCSGNEIKIIKKVCGEKFLTLVPGITIKEEKRPDQKRKISLKQAIKYGADYVVIGREIYNAVGNKDIGFNYDNI